jgi:mannose-6-phosphate isomerase-like protein (cupin superfamily)
MKTEPRLVKGHELLDASTHAGAQSGHAGEEVNLTLLAWPAGQGVATHINEEVEVVIIVIDGSGRVTIDDTEFEVSAGDALLVPKGCRRAIRSTSDGFAYFSVHRRRPGLMPSFAVTT